MKLQTVLCTETLVTISFLKMEAVCEILAVSCHLPGLPPCTHREEDRYTHTGYVSLKHLTSSCRILKGYVDTDIATFYQFLKEEEEDVPSLYLIPKQ